MGDVIQRIADSNKTYNISITLGKPRFQLINPRFLLIFVLTRVWVRDGIWKITRDKKQVICHHFDYSWRTPLLAGSFIAYTH